LNNYIFFYHELEPLPSNGPDRALDSEEPVQIISQLINSSVRWLGVTYDAGV